MLFEESNVTLALLRFFVERGGVSNAQGIIKYPCSIRSFQFGYLSRQTWGSFSHMGSLRSNPIIICSLSKVQGHRPDCHKQAEATT